MDNLLAVVDNIMENTTQELLGSGQIQKSSTSRLLEALDNFIENIAFIYDSMKEKPFILVISAYNFRILLSISIETYSRVMYFLSQETKMVMLLLR